MESGRLAASVWWSAQKAYPVDSGYARCGVAFAGCARTLGLEGLKGSWRERSLAEFQRAFPDEASCAAFLFARRCFYRHVSFETMLGLAARHQPVSYWDIVNRENPRKDRHPPGQKPIPDPDHANHKM